MNLPATTQVKTAEDARELAIDWQAWQAEKDLSYGEILEYTEYFQVLAHKFNLTEEFKENGII